MPAILLQAHDQSKTTVICKSCDA